MIISRERYLDDGPLHHVGLVLQTRTREMHSLLSDAPEDVRERIGDILVHALDEVQAVLTPALVAPPRQGTSAFGCGT
jgi:hypothetical protein